MSSTACGVNLDEKTIRIESNDNVTGASDGCNKCNKRKFSSTDDAHSTTQNKRKKTRARKQKDAPGDALTWDTTEVTMYTCRLCAYTCDRLQHMNRHALRHSDEKVSQRGRKSNEIGALRASL